MSTPFSQLESEYGERLRREFANVFGDMTPNPKGATPTREALDERSPAKAGEA